MRGIMGYVGTGLVLFALGAIGAVVVVIAMDPACGPDGDSQRTCAAEIVRNITGGQ